MATKKTTAVKNSEPPKTTAVSTALDFSADAGRGMEGATQESFAIPFLMTLQKGSPQVDEASGVAIDGAKAGMLYDNISGQLFDGKEGVRIVPCAYRRVFIRWGSEASGEGFKGEIDPEVVAEMRHKGEVKELDNRLYFPLEDGTVNEKKCDRLSDTRNHYILIIDEATGFWREALLSLSSTQIKKSKMLMSALAGVKVQSANGMYTPPTFANVVHVTTIPESNDKGTWYGVRFQLDGHVKRSEIYAAAKAFHGKVAKGVVEAKYEEAHPADGSDASNGF
jgi:hypothetical protein